MESCTEATKPVGSLKGGKTFLWLFSQVFLQEIATRRYFRAPSTWSMDQAHALQFRTGYEARECATRLKLTNVQIVIMEELRECRVFMLNNKQVRVWPAQHCPETPLRPAGLRRPFSVLQIWSRLPVKSRPVNCAPAFRP
jgi:hypothetical protein